MNSALERWQLRRCDLAVRESRRQLGGGVGPGAHDRAGVGAHGQPRQGGGLEPGLSVRVRMARAAVGGRQGKHQYESLLLMLERKSCGG